MQPSFVQNKWIDPPLFALVSSWIRLWRQRVRSSQEYRCVFSCFLKNIVLHLLYLKRHIIWMLPFLFDLPMGCNWNISSSVSWTPSCPCTGRWPSKSPVSTEQLWKRSFDRTVLSHPQYPLNPIFVSEDLCCFFFNLLNDPLSSIIPKLNPEYVVFSIWKTFCTAVKEDVIRGLHKDVKINSGKI